MKPPIQNSTTLLTGASAGIGWAMAHELANQVKTLIIVARRKERLEALKKELIAKNAQLEVVVYPCDLTDIEKIKTMLDELEKNHGVIDIVINNAGFGDMGVFEYADWDKLQRMIQLNITALTYITHRLIAPMRAQNKGGVLNISSGAGVMFYPGFNVYAATKHYVTAFTEALRCELAGTGVVISQICPGPVKTEFVEKAENPTSYSVPPFLELSAERCAKISIRGFSKGKALIVPGTFANIMIGASRLTPRFILRFVFGLSSKKLYQYSESKKK